MKNHSHALSFLSGAALSLAICLCGTTALAAAGDISFNNFQIDLDGKTVISKGEELTTASGAKIPSTVVYTDANGGSTTYVPLRLLCETADMSVLWYGDNKSISLHTGCLDDLLYLSLSGCTGDNNTGAIYERSMQEITPIISTAQPNLLPSVDYSGKSGFEKFIPLDETKGKYVSVTVTNNGDNPIEFDLGSTSGSKTNTPSVGAYASSIVPAHSTVTRTMQLFDGATENIGKLYAFAGYQYCPYGDVDSLGIDITISAVQFSNW